MRKRWGIVLIFMVFCFLSGCGMYGDDDLFDVDYPFVLDPEGQTNVAVAWYWIEETPFFPAEGMSTSKLEWHADEILGDDVLTVHARSATENEELYSTVELKMAQKVLTEREYVETNWPFDHIENGLLELALELDGVRYTHDHFEDFASNTFARVAVEREEDGVVYMLLHATLYGENENDSVTIRGYIKFVHD